MSRPATVHCCLSYGYSDRGGTGLSGLAQHEEQGLWQRYSAGIILRLGQGGLISALVDKDLVRSSIITLANWQVSRNNGRPRNHLGGLSGGGNNSKRFGGGGSGKMAGELAAQIGNMTLGGADAGDGEGVMRSACQSLHCNVHALPLVSELWDPTCAGVLM